MTDEQINAAIAEACGWTNINVEDRSGISPTNGLRMGSEFFPKYTKCLNAMHEAEKILKGYEQIHTYVWHLENRQDWATDVKLMDVHISAKDRAEAFLKTLGKWEEAQG